MTSVWLGALIGMLGPKKTPCPVQAGKSKAALMLEICRGRPDHCSSLPCSCRAQTSLHTSIYPYHFSSAITLNWTSAHSEVPQMLYSPQCWF